jgi:hypothetical protein
MGLLDTILGRSKPVRANLDALFSLPTAALTLESAGGLVSSGHAGVCWKPPAGQVAAVAQKEVTDLVGDGFRQAVDSFDYGWLLLDDPELDELVTKVHMANSTLQDNGWGPQLLASVFGFVPGPDAGTDAKPFRLVYLFKRGTFYPFLEGAARHRTRASHPQHARSGPPGRTGSEPMVSHVGHARLVRLTRD